LSNLAEGLKTLSSLQSINLDFEQKVTLADVIVEILIGASKSQIKVSIASVKVSKDSAPWNLSISTLIRKFLLDHFFLFPGMGKLQTKDWTPSAKASKDPVPYILSISGFSKWLLDYEFVDLLIGVMESLIKVWIILVKVWWNTVPCNPSFSNLKGASISQIKVWRASVWKLFVPYNPSISTFQSRKMDDFWKMSLLTNRCINIKDQGLKSLGKSLKRLSCLEFIHLNINRLPLEDELIDFVNSCEQITDQGLKYLGEGLNELNSLQSIFLNVGG